MVSSNSHPQVGDFSGDYPPGGYLKEIPKDEWGRDFIYKAWVGDKSHTILLSWGADGEAGGEGIDADLRVEN